MRYMIFILAVMALFFIPLTSSAQVVITEIMYDLEGADTGREWIEIKNTGTESVDLSEWKLYEANTNHKLLPVTVSMLSAGEFGVIADDLDKFALDNPNFSGIVFDSAFSLGNQGEAMILRDGNGIDKDSVTYDSSIGAAGNGNTLQKNASGEWIASSPTLGSETVASVSVIDEQGDIGGDGDDEKDSEGKTVSSKNVDQSSSHSSPAAANISFDAPELIVASGRPRISFVGVPLRFEAKVKNMKNIHAGNAVAYTWSLGDGMSTSGQFVSHVYDFPGEYIVILNSSVGGAEAVSKTKVKIVEPKAGIRSAGNGAIEISNLDKGELNVGTWKIETETERFFIPDDTIIQGRSSIIIPAKATRLTTMPNNIRLVNPSGATVASDIALNPSNAPSLNPDDISISLPQGVDEVVIRQRVMAQLGVDASLDRQNLAKTESGETPSIINDPKDELAKMEIPTTSLPAAVIFTMPKSDISLWEAVKGIWKK